MSRWFILRTSGGQTLPLMRSLRAAGFDVCTPAKVQRRAMRAKTPSGTRTIEVDAPILPTFLFAREEDLEALAQEASTGETSHVASRHPGFSIFNRGGKAPMVSAAAIAGLQAEEAREQALIAAIRDAETYQEAERIRIEGLKTEAARRRATRALERQQLRQLRGKPMRVVARADLAGALDDETAVLLLTHVHYKTAERFDLAAWTARAQAAGALILWDFSHSAGAVAIDVTAAGVDLAVGCTYKYLNGGPGAPAFLYVAERWQAALANPVSGWMGHAEPFAFQDAYRPAAGMARWLVGTPPILAMASLEAALAIWDEVDMAAIAAKSAVLFAILARAGAAAGLPCVTPADPARRGSHISFRHDHAYAVTQALIARGVIGDFRAPDVVRLGLTPLYLSHEDVWRAGEHLRDVIETEAWRDPAFATRNPVT